MISVLVLGCETATGRPATSGDSVRTLIALVSGAVDGVIRDVTLLATDPAAELAKVADHAGCGFIAKASLAEALQAGAAQARSEQLLVLLAGVSFDRALSDEIAAQAARPSGTAAGGVRVRAVAGGWLGRVAPAFAPTIGLLTTRQRVGRARAGGFVALLRALQPRRSFKTRAWSGTV
jgi:aryl-alcohol dehydrogenase-like predicted oxidoreductase